MKICPVCSTEYPDDVKFCPNDGQTLRSAAPASDLVGQVVADRYHVVKKLGEGGMGQVYLAEHVKMGRRSAIKVMNPSMVHDPDAVARFNREASNASRITHPNVCAIYDFGETPDGLIYLAMEFIEGEPLTDLIEREGALPVPRAAAIFLQTADALQAAHDLGIVHRDLKPDNIMLSRRKGGGDTVKVVDFGIAKAVGGDEAGQKVTKTGLVVGTPEFMSPEQLSGDTLDGRSDLYSLALVLYRMLSGKLPFEATSVQETMIKRLTDEPTTLAAARPDLSFPPGLQPVLDTALARTPTERYQSVAKFAADVAAVTGRPTASAVPHTRSMGDTEGKTQLLDPTAGGATQRISAQQAAPAQKRSLLPVVAGVVVILAGGGAWVALNGGNKAGANPRDSTPSVVHDTATNSTGRQSGGTTTLPVRDSGRRPAPPPALPPAPPSAPTGIDPTKASQILDALIESPPAVVKDSAAKVYDTKGVASSDRAFAACMVARAYEDLRNHATALQWANRGLALNSQLSACRSVIQGGS
ncbi:MAG TPA: serine/threonine-protein kinase [Gemmatimonadales bacterium]|nr:serine/threonine-protein kinase [Gemmatimonadales bacterium]